MLTDLGSLQGKNKKPPKNQKNNNSAKVKSMGKKRENLMMQHETVIDIR
jgi:hypothetical protein